MDGERWHENIVVRVALAAAAGIVILLGLLGLFHERDAVPGLSSTEHHPGGWVSAVPDSLRGAWAVEGRCEDEEGLMLIFSNGGYRWRKSHTDWGFARGQVPLHRLQCLPHRVPASAFRPAQ